MGRVQIAVQLRRPGAPPQALAGAGELDGPQVVQVTALRVEDLAEHALLGHVVDHHLHPVVVAVLHQHAMLLELLGRLDNRPAVLEGHRRRHLGRGVLPVLHRGQHDRHVPFPRRRVVDEVQFLGLAQPLEIARAARVRRRRAVAGLRDGLGGPLCALRPDVADGRDAAAGNLQEILDVARPLAADADVADADLGNRCGGKSGGRPVLRRRISARRDGPGDDHAAAHFEKITTVQALTIPV